MDFTLRHFGKEVEGRTARLGFIIGLRRTSDKSCMHNDVKTWDSWDHYPNCAIMEENEASLLGEEEKEETDNMEAKI